MSGSKVIYQIVDADLFSRGIFETLDLAKEAADTLNRQSGAFYQVNEIPLNKLGRYSEDMDDVYTVGDVEGEA
jgi:hypothetical protein